MENIHIKEPEKLKIKLEKIKKDEISSLHIVSDFDKTLTTAFIEGKKIQSSYSLIRNGGYLTEDYAQQAFGLYDKYHPYELDPNLTIEEKCKKMEEWWAAHWKLMIECGMNIGVFQDIIQKGNVQLRDGAKHFFQKLSLNKVPILIFSSGLGNMIEEFLKSENLITDNVHLISNFFRMDEEGKAIDFKKPLIHVFNKSEVELHNYPYHKEVENKKNVILLGDSLGDLGMTEGVKHETIIRVGFLNDKVEEHLELYKEEFDVVITNDGNLSYINRILDEIINHN